MMAFITQRTRLCLVLVLALVVALFSIDTARGQFGPRGPGNASSSNSPFEHSYRCTKCGATFTSSAIGGPSHCPSCGVKFINGGIDRPGGAFGSDDKITSPSPASTASSAGTVLLVFGGGMFLVIVLVIGLGVFLLIYLNRRPAVAAVPVARLRSRYRDDDRFEER